MTTKGSLGWVVYYVVTHCPTNGWKNENTANKVCWNKLANGKSHQIHAWKTSINGNHVTLFLEYLN